MQFNPVPVSQTILRSKRRLVFCCLINDVPFRSQSQKFTLYTIDRKSTKQWPSSVIITNLQMRTLQLIYNSFLF